MLVWNGRLGLSYDPRANFWEPISAATGVDRWGSIAPTHGWTVVWTGSEMIVWGGAGGNRPTVDFNVGARYDPETDRWSPIPAQGAPAPSSGHAAVWTGSGMVIWGGGAVPGGIYHPTWLTVLTGTERQSADGTATSRAEAGERYRVIEIEKGRARVQLVGDAPSVQWWIPIDARVRITSPQPEHVGP